MPKTFGEMTLTELDAELAACMDAQLKLKQKQREIQVERSKRIAEAGADKLIATLSPDQREALSKALGKVYVEKT